MNSKNLLIKKSNKNKEDNSAARNHRNLNDIEKQELVSMIAEGICHKEINEHLQERYGFFLSERALQYYRKSSKWKPVIAKLREEYISAVHEVAISHKRVRLERAEKIYNKSYGEGDFSFALEVLRFAQKEMDPRANDTSVTNLSIYQQFNNLSDDELNFKKNQLMEKLKLLESKKEVPSGQSRIEE